MTLPLRGARRLPAGAVAALDADGEARQRGDRFVQEITLLAETRYDLAAVGPQMPESGADGDGDDDRLVAFCTWTSAPGSAAKNARQYAATPGRPRCFTRPRPERSTACRDPSNNGAGLPSRTAAG